MSLILRIIRFDPNLHPTTLEHHYSERGGSVGRSPSNEWVLIDPRCYLSGQHARFYFQAGHYWIADTSTNGVFLNHSKIPLGQNNSTSLKEGDVLRMGQYGFIVSFAAAEKTAVMPVEPDHSDPFADLFGELASPPSRHDLSSVQPVQRDDNRDKIKDHSATKYINFVTHNSSHYSATIQDFFKGLALDNPALEARLFNYIDLEQVGRLFRVFVQGTLDTLQTRAELKTNLALDKTTIQPKANNPFKFSTNVEQALVQLFLSQTQTYLSAEQALHEVYADINAHQVASLTGMQAVLKHIIQRFRPEQLTERLQVTNPISAGIPIHRQAKLWALFEELYSTLEAEAEQDIQQLLGSEFSRVYEQHIALVKSKRMNDK